MVVYAGSGDVAFGRAGSLAAVVADDFVDLYDEITGNVRFPRCEFLQCDDITWHDDWCK